MSVMNHPLSEKLRAARASRGLSLADVAHVTRIPVPRLIQLEEGNYAAFGSMTYARSFIRTYSKFLEVDAEDLIDELPEPVLGGRGDYRHLTSSYGPWINKRAPQLPAVPRPRRQTSPAFTALLLTLVIGVGVAAYAILCVMPGLLRKGRAEALTSAPVAPARARSLAPGADMAPREEIKIAELPPTTYVDAAHPHVPYRRAIPADESPSTRPMAQ